MFKRLSPILALSFVDIIGYSLLLPILPSILNIYIPKDQIGFYYGLMISAYSLFQFFAAPFLGSLSDKYGRKPILLISQIGTAFGWIIFGLAYFIPSGLNILGMNLAILVLIFARIIDGLTGGNISVSNAWIADTTNENERAQAYGLIGGVFGIGILAGPLLGAFAGSTSIGYLGVAILAFLFSLSSILLTQFNLSESLTIEKRIFDKKLNYFEEINIFKQIAKFKGNKLLEKALILRLFYAISFASFFTNLIIVITSYLDISPIFLGIIVTVFALITGLIQVFILPKIHDLLGHQKALFLSLGIFIIGLFILPFLHLDKIDLTKNIYPIGTILFLIIALIANLGVSLGGLAFKTIFSNNVKNYEHGLIQGIDESLVTFGNGITPIFAGILFMYFGLGSFWFFGGILLICVIVLLLN